MNKKEPIELLYRIDNSIFEDLYSSFKEDVKLKIMSAMNKADYWNKDSVRRRTLYLKFITPYIPVLIKARRKKIKYTITGTEFVIKEDKDYSVDFLLTFKTDVQYNKFCKLLEEEYGLEATDD